MKPALLTVGAAAVFFAGAFFWREIVAVASRAPAVPARGDDVFGDRFLWGLLIPVAPIAVFLGLALGLIVPSSQSFEEATIGLVLVASAMALVLQTLCGELLLWAHRAKRLDRATEARIVQRLRRAGAVVNEVWVSESPIVVFWRFTLLSPAVIVRARALVWRETLDRMPETGAGGLVLCAPAARFWPWAVLPLGAAAALRLRDPLSLIPWWVFGASAALIAVGAIPDALAWMRLRASLRTDSGVAEEIEGALACGILEAELALARALRNGGLVARWSAASAWQRAIRKARRAAKRSGVDDGAVRSHAERLLHAGSAASAANAGTKVLPRQASGN